MAVKRYIVISEPSEKWTEGRGAVWAESGKTQMQQFQEDGTLLRAGRFTSTADGGGIVIFSTREAAEEFAAGSPFQAEGLVKNSEILRVDRDSLR